MGKIDIVSIGKETITKGNEKMKTEHRLYLANCGKGQTFESLEAMKNFLRSNYGRGSFRVCQHNQVMGKYNNKWYEVGTYWKKWN